jgi:hypothetical protein
VLPYKTQVALQHHDYHSGRLQHGFSAALVLVKELLMSQEVIMSDKSSQSKYMSSLEGLLKAPVCFMQHGQPISALQHKQLFKGLQRDQYMDKLVSEQYWSAAVNGQTRTPVQHGRLLATYHECIASPFFSSPADMLQVYLYFLTRLQRLHTDMTATPTKFKPPSPAK